MKRRTVFLLGLLVLLAAALIPSAAASDQAGEIQLNREYQGSFSFKIHCTLPVATALRQKPF